MRPLLTTNHPHGVLRTVLEMERRSGFRVNLTASENQLSPCARMPFLLNSHTRYQLDDNRVFGESVFPAGNEIHYIEHEFLIPQLQDLLNARYVNVRPLSGLNAMLVCIAAMTSPGDLILTIPSSLGGHASTNKVCRHLGRQCLEVPMLSHPVLDEESFIQLINRTSPKAIYIDSATFLSPPNSLQFKKAIERSDHKPWLIYDASHTLGLIMGKVLPNPLDEGVDILCGSTHKTFPGPIKGIIATNRMDEIGAIQQTADALISHHHSASVVSLAIATSEFIHCGGAAYAEQIVVNARHLAQCLSDREFTVASTTSGWTDCHQLWINGFPRETKGLHQALIDHGIYTNNFPHLPGFGQGLRLSTAEFTRLGGDCDDIELLADIFQAIWLRPEVASSTVDDAIHLLAARLKTPEFCYRPDGFTFSHIIGIQQ